jgi:hypothetical protein
MTGEICRIVHFANMSLKNSVMHVWSKQWKFSSYGDIQRNTDWKTGTLEK